MKKFIALLLALLTVCACSTALAAPVGYESEKNYMCEDFEDADNTMIGKEDSPVAKAFDKHDMDPYYFADGTMEITNDGENGSKGLKLIPDYYSDLQNGSDVILRTQLQRVCATLDESKREEVRKAWSEATGFSFYIKNETGSNVLCVPGLFLQLGEDRTLALGAGLDTVLMEKDGTVIDTEFTNGWSNTSVIIPVDFEGWLIQKNILCASSAGSIITSTKWISGRKPVMTRFCAKSAIHSSFWFGPFRDRTRNKTPCPVIRAATGRKTNITSGPVSLTRCQRC